MQICFVFIPLSFIKLFCEYNKQKFNLHVLQVYAALYNCGFQTKHTLFHILLATPLESSRDIVLKERGRGYRQLTLVLLRKKM